MARTYQSRWRIAGAVAIACCAIMAWYGAQHAFMSASLLGAILYWGLCLLFLLVSLYTVLLDVRYIRLQYAIARRELFVQTLGDEKFRKSLIEARKKCPPTDEGD